jgi:hypothetical protein
MAVVSLDLLSCEVPCLIMHSVVYRDVTRQAKGLHRLKYVGALKSGLAYLSRCNSGWFCHKFLQQNTNSLAKHYKQTMSLAMPYMIRVFIWSSSLITKRGTQLS